MTHPHDWLKALVALQPTTTWQEWLAALTGLLCAWLTVKNKLSNWPWGIVSVLAYSWVFWQAKLYASFGLNLLYFFPCCVYGWWYWARGGPAQNDDLPVRKLSAKQNAIWVALTLAATFGIGYPIARFTNDPIPYADSLATGMSIIAQWMQAKKWYENWWYWIGLDIVYIAYVYPTQHLYVSMALYMVYLAVAIRGAVEWRHLLHGERYRSYTENA